MAKSDQLTVMNRVQDVSRLLLAGAAHEDIRQFASAHNWNVSDRQLRRYQERAYKKLVKAAQQDQQQLLGRHLLQRRALYARAMKTNDIRTALFVLKDEAALEGLYELAKQPVQASSPRTTITRRNRLRRLLAARQENDREGVELVESTSPHSYYVLPDLRMPEMMLAVLATQHAAEQLDHATMLMMALWRLTLRDETEEFWSFMGTIHGWRYRIGKEGWERFAEDIGFDGDQYLLETHNGSALELFDQKIFEVCPQREDVEQALLDAGRDPTNVISADSIVRKWHSQLNEILEK